MILISWSPTIRDYCNKTFKDTATGCMILFIHTCPWAAKIWTLIMAVVSDFVAVPSSNTERYRYVFALVCLATLSSVLPSLLYSTSNRSLTTSYVMQSCLYLTGTHTLLELLTAHSQQHCVLVTYLLLCHFLSGQISGLKQQRRTLLYCDFIVRLNFALICILSVVCLLICPPVHMQGVWMTAILFLPEVLGLCVSAVHSATKGLGDLYEEYMSEDVRYKYE